MTGPRRITARSSAARVGAQQIDWLALVEPRGQFLTLPVLRSAFPDGLPGLDSEVRRDARERAKTIDFTDPGAATGWLEHLLQDVLEWGDRLRIGPQVPDQLSHYVAEKATALRPEYALLGADGRARVLVERYDSGTMLDARIPGETWSATPIDRTVLLCRALAIPIGIVTNGRLVTLIHAPQTGAPGYGTWDTSLFAEGAEGTLLDAFVALMGARSFFGRGKDTQLEALFAQSAAAQADLTVTLGLQVRRAVELLVAAISRANLEQDGDLLRGVTPHRVYEAASTVVMRLVFLLYAEERHLLPLGEELYDNNYAIATLREQLVEESDLAGDEPLELRSDAWQRILATSRAVYGGVTHDRLRMPAYHGSLFDPDRYPFLEGRPAGSSWQNTPAVPVRVDDLTVREILSALQIIQTSEGGVTEARRLSFRALDVEQIGHVYEGLLDHAALRAETTILGLVGKPGQEPEIALDQLETARTSGTAELAALVAELSGRSTKGIEKLIDAPLDDDLRRRLLTSCDNDAALVARLEPFARLLREDLRGLPTVFLPGSIYVTETSQRRDTGTEYTTRELAEEIVIHALEPQVYAPGPRDGQDRNEWVLKSPSEILQITVCDPAVGSGAILVAACRYLADRLVEARLMAGEVLDGYEYDPSATRDEDELVVQARRDVADRCLFGVDRDPMAVEMAKLSLWLTTLSRERPFTFVDHAIQAGDSLLGLDRVEQILNFHVDPSKGRLVNKDLFGDLTQAISPVLEDLLNLRRQLEEQAVLTVRDVERKTTLNEQARVRSEEARVVADLVVAAAMRAGSSNQLLEEHIAAFRELLLSALQAPAQDRTERFDELAAQAAAWINHGRPDAAPVRVPLHWPLAFPEVFQAGGFSAIVANPPYLGGKYWKSRLGEDFGPWAARLLNQTNPGFIDLCVVFFRRSWELLGESGTFGLLTALNLKSGASARTGPGHLTRPGELFRARTSVPWPGGANVYVNLVWASRLPYESVWCDGATGRAITSDLLLAGAPTSERPVSLPDGIWAFEGSNNGKGQAFLLREGDPWLDELRAADSPYLRAYFSGDDITGHGLTAVKRYCVDTLDASLEEVAATCPATMRFLSEVVQPTRTREDLVATPGLFERWWQYKTPAADSYRRLRLAEHCWAVASVSKYFVALPGPTAATYTNKARLLGELTRAQEVALYSDLMDIWVWKFSGRMKKDLNVTTAVFGQFPPVALGDQAPDPSTWPSALKSLLPRFGSITAVLNAYHDPSNRDAAVLELRALRGRFNESVSDSLGASHSLLERDFHETEAGVRFTFAPYARDELLELMVRKNREHGVSATGATSGVGRRRGGTRAGSATDPTMQDQLTLEMP